MLGVIIGRIFKLGFVERCVHSPIKNVFSLYRVVFQVGMVFVLFGCTHQDATLEKKIVPTKVSNLVSLPTATILSVQTPPMASPIPEHVDDKEEQYVRGNLIFSDEFSGDHLNTSYWNTQYQWGRLDSEEGSYLSPEAFELRNGVLYIKADDTPVGGRRYSAGAISSYDYFEFMYGYVEMRAKLPAGQGLWSALWLLTLDPEDVEEIDIVELLGQDPSTIYMTLHYPDLANRISTQEQTVFTGPDFSSEFHTYAVDWEPDRITWFVDGIKRAEILDNIPQKPMCVIVTLAVGGEWPGYPDDTTPFPAYLNLDYIRVYSKP